MVELFLALRYFSHHNNSPDRGKGRGAEILQMDSVEIWLWLTSSAGSTSLQIKGKYLSLVCAWLYEAVSDVDD